MTIILVSPLCIGFVRRYHQSLRDSTMRDRETPTRTYPKRSKSSHQPQNCWSIECGLSSGRKTILFGRRESSLDKAQHTVHQVYLVI